MWSLKGSRLNEKEEECLRQLLCSNSPCFESHLLLQPLWQEVTISIQPSTSHGRCNPTVPFSGSQANNLLLTDFSDTLNVEYSWEPAKHSEVLGSYNLRSQPCPNGNRNWWINALVSHPLGQTALTHFVKLFRMCQCHGLECQSPVW